MRDSASISTPGHWSKDLVIQLVGGLDEVVVFHHEGPVDHLRLEQLIELAEARSMAAMDGVSLRKRLINVLVEGLENVHRHTPPEMADTGFALLVRRGEGYRIVLGNALPAVSAALLAHRVEILNAMDEADLREHYLKLLANTGRTERGGAGLGLLTMARKSTRPMVMHSTARDGSTMHIAIELTLTVG
jgi:hypothetical protein